MPYCRHCEQSEAISRQGEGGANARFQPIRPPADEVVTVGFGSNPDSQTLAATGESSPPGLVVVVVHAGTDERVQSALSLFGHVPPPLLTIFASSAL